MSIINVVAEAVRRSATRGLQLGRWRGVERASRSTRVVVDRFDAEFGIASDWPQSGHARYYEKSAAVHAAVKVRADAVARPGLRVLTRESGSLHRGEYRDAGADDPMMRLLERPNEMWTQGQLLRATETYLALWGSAFWGIERDSAGNASELWPLRPDRVRIIPDRNRHVRGFVYEHGGERAAYLPQEIVWFRHINPADEFLGMSSLSPARLAVDMGEEALSFNRSFFRNSTMPSDLAITTEETPTEDEVSEFYTRWESRFRGSGKAHRPVLLSRGMDAKRLGISHKDMEFTQALRWSVEEVARAFGVPKVFLGQLEDATLSNVETLERYLWRNTVVPELRLIEQAINSSVTPLFESFPGQRRVEFDLGDIEALKESENDRVEREVKLVAAGIITVDEARAGRNLEPIG